MDFPSKSYREEKNKRENGGVDVLPGTYRAVLHYGDVTSETSIVVEEDPRIDELTTADRMAKYNAMKKLEMLVTSVEQVTTQLAKNKKLAEDFKKLLTAKDKELYKEQIKATDTIIKGITAQQDYYFGKEDDRQGITSSKEVTVLNRLYTARGYIDSRQGQQTATETRLFEQAQQAANERTKESNAWLAENWTPFVEKMKAVTVEMWE